MFFALKIICSKAYYARIGSVPSFLIGGCCQLIVINTNYKKAILCECIFTHVHVLHIEPVSSF